MHEAILGRRTGTDSWTFVLAAATVAGTLATACMMPFVALATVTAATMSRPRAAGTIAAAWAANQAIGFGLLGYPPTASAIAWGAALLAATLVAMVVTSRVLGTGRAAVVRLAPAFLAAFAVYEAGLYAFARVAGGTGTFTAAIIARIGLNDAAWFAALIAAHAVLTRAAPRAFGPSLRIAAA